MDNESILQELTRMDKEAKGIRDNAIRIAWYMRGGASINDVMEASEADRELMAALVKENLETTKKSGMPFF
jgi:hypothetical protein